MSIFKGFSMVPHLLPPSYSGTSQVLVPQLSVSCACGDKSLAHCHISGEGRKKLSSLCSHAEQMKEVAGSLWDSDCRRQWSWEVPSAGLNPSLTEFSWSEDLITDQNTKHLISPTMADYPQTWFWFSVFSLLLWSINSYNPSKLQI